MEDQHSVDLPFFLFLRGVLRNIINLFHECKKAGDFPIDIYLQLQCD
jgi:hypothetical protein